MKNSCINKPFVEGAPSSLYEQMLKNLNNDRPLVNLLYAMYTTQGVAEDMDKAKKGYKRNKQGEHSYKDVYEFLNFKAFLEQRNNTLIFDAKLLGALDNNNNYILFTSIDEAYQKALDYNNSHSGRFAYVVEQANGYNIIIKNKDANTNKLYTKFVEQVKLWEVFKEKLRESDVDIEEFLKVTQNKANPITIKEYLNNISILKHYDNNILGAKDIAIFLFLGKNNPLVRQLLNRGWGSLEEVSQKCYEILHTDTYIGSEVFKLVNRALDVAKNNSDLDLEKTKMDVLKFSKDFKDSEESKLDQHIYYLQNKYKLKEADIKNVGDKINSLEEAVSSAIVTIEREIRKLQSEKGVTKTVKKLTQIKDALSIDLSRKKSCQGLLFFLKEAVLYSNKIEKLFEDIPLDSDNKTYIRNSSEVISKANAFVNGYHDIIRALANLDNLIIEENLTSEDKKMLKDSAKEVLELLDKVQNRLLEKAEDTTIKSLQEELGSDTENGVAYADIVKIIHKDASIIDYVGQLGKSSNEILAASGSIIRNAQHNRDEKLRQFSTRIGRITKKLYSSGYSSDFMYDKYGHIITKQGVDWYEYQKARHQAIREFKEVYGFSGLDLTEAIEGWEENNTEPVVVDKTNGRTEQIPNEKYRVSSEKNPYNKLSKEQKEYYEEIMQIKGELGSMLPYYAQNHFIPPQKRAGILDLLKYAFQKKLSAYQLAHIVLDRIKSPLKTREDDVEYQSSFSYGDYDNTPLRDIPIHYVKKLQNSKELLRDFSATIQMFASTAINYEAMSSIRHQIETIRLHINTLNTLSVDGRGSKQVDVVTYYDSDKQEYTNILTELREYATKSQVQTILDSYVEQQFYNKNYKGNDKTNKTTNYLLQYNSIIKLSANVVGMTANLLNGVLQTITESGGGEFYNIKNLVKAMGILFGEEGVKSPGKMWDWVTDNKSSKFTLMCDFFDVAQDNYAEVSKKRYHRNIIRRLFGSFNIVGGYAAGEFLMRTVNGIAVLDHVKVKLNGKKVPLLDAFELTEDKYYPELKLKDGVTDLKGNPLTLDSQFFKDVKLKIKSCSDTCFGAFSKEDKGIINQFWLGRVIMNFRQWMVEYFLSRYRPKYFDYTRQKWVRGKYWSVLHIMKEMVVGLRDYGVTMQAFKHAMSKEDLQNAGRVISEILIWFTLAWVNGDDDEEEEKKRRAAKEEASFWSRFWKLELLRLEREIGAGTPWGIITEFENILKSPVPLVNTINNNLFYPIEGLLNGDWKEENKITKGRHKDWNRYYRNLLWYTVPFYKQIDQLMHIHEEDNLYYVYSDRKR